MYILWIDPLQTGGSGQAENELASHAFRADHIDIFSVSLDDLLHNREAKAGSLLILSAGQISLVEALPDLFHTVFRDSDACILY